MATIEESMTALMLARMSAQYVPQNPLMSAMTAQMQADTANVKLNVNQRNYDGAAPARTEESELIQQEAVIMAKLAAKDPKDSNKLLYTGMDRVELEGGLAGVKVRLSRVNEFLTAQGSMLISNPKAL